MKNANAESLDMVLIEIVCLLLREPSTRQTAMTRAQFRQKPFRRSKVCSHLLLPGPKISQSHQQANGILNSSATMISINNASSRFY